jgi:cyanophycinase
MGGGSRPEAMIQRLIDESGLEDQGYGIILPMASAEPDSAGYYGKKQFSDLGVERIYDLQLSHYNIKPALIDSIENASLIYIAGGDQNRFMEFVKRTPLEAAIFKAFTNGSMIAGTSAGAAVMSDKMITGKELKYPEYSPTFKTIEADNLELNTGLNLLGNAVIDQHFLIRSRHNRLLTAILEYPDLIGIGIDEATALFIVNGVAEVIGESQVLVLKNPEKKKRLIKGKLGGRNISIDIYLPGDKFIIK